MRTILSIAMILLTSIAYSQTAIVDPSDRDLFEIKSDSGYFHIPDASGHYFSGKAVVKFTVNKDKEIESYNLVKLALISLHDTISCNNDCDRLYRTQCKTLLDHCIKSVKIIRNCHYKGDEDKSIYYNIVFRFR